MIPNEYLMEMMRLDFHSLENILKSQSAMLRDLRDRHFKALKKILLMELLLTMDLPRDRIKLSEGNISWLLRNVGIENGENPNLQRVIRLLKEFTNEQSE